MALLTGNLTYDLLAILCGILVCIITYYKWAFTYWKRRGLESLPPSIPFGNMSDVFLGRVFLGEKICHLYNEIKKAGWKHGGIYFFTSPVYIPTDPDIIKHIMQVDFPHFVNHGNYINEEVDPLSVNLFGLEDERWKNMRVKLTPTFTSGKIRMMFQTLIDCTSGLKNIMDDHSNKNTPVDIKEVLARFTTDVIGSCAFGIECNTLKNPDSIFREYGRKAIEPDLMRMVKVFVQMVVPDTILKKLNFSMTDKDVVNFFTDIVTNTVNYREQNSVERKDFLELLIQLKNKSQHNGNKEITASGLSMTDIIAQCFVFYVAGFETSSTTNTFTLYELAKNQDIQQELRDEIHKVLKQHNGQITYEAVKEMTFMDKVVQESLRKYPPGTMLSRVCNRKYTVPGTSVTLEEGTKVLISVMGLHRDPEHYPNPEIFDPHRFDEEVKSRRHPFTWIPFGEGPRICIGMRFGLLQSKVGLITLLKDYQVFLNEKTKEPLEFSKKGLVLTVKGGVWLNVQKIK